ncbi:nickel insertion protein [Candidatus Neomarinimicrobiota bacterium]
MLKNDSVVTIRTPSGISGDMLVTGLSLLAEADAAILDSIVADTGMNVPDGSFKIERTAVDEISGWRAKVTLPNEHVHRSHDDIRKIITGSQLRSGAKEIALKAFSILADAEATVHDLASEDVTFHEVGALDSILDICLAAALIDMLAPQEIVCSPLPICDGQVMSAHGLLQTPAPAVQELLVGIPVYSVDTDGETVTPTALALLRAIAARFGAWPPQRIAKSVRVYGSRILPNIPNGAIFAIGCPLSKEELSSWEMALSDD